MYSRKVKYLHILCKAAQPHSSTVRPSLSPHIIHISFTKIRLANEVCSFIGCWVFVYHPGMAMKWPTYSILYWPWGWRWRISVWAMHGHLRLHAEIACILGRLYHDLPAYNGFATFCCCTEYSYILQNFVGYIPNYYIFLLFRFSSILH